jgi:hypothetical protein
VKSDVISVGHKTESCEALVEHGYLPRHGSAAQRASTLETAVLGAGANPVLPLSSTNKERLGIGLSLCRLLIETRGGRIWLAACAPGAAIQLTLPVAPVPSPGLSFHD